MHEAVFIGSQALVMTLVLGFVGGFGAVVAWRIPPRWWAELGYCGAFYGAYMGMSGVPLPNVWHVARVHGAQLVDVERTLGLRWEPAVQHALAAIGGQAGYQAAELYYNLAHVLVTVGVACWLLYARPRQWPQARNVLAAVSIISLAIFLLYPAAPPRLVPAAGVYGLGPVEGSASVVLATFPSLHTAWAEWVALVVWRAGRGRWWRWLGPAHAAVTALVVIGTANHYVLDCLAATALVAASDWALRGRRGRQGAPAACMVEGPALEAVGAVS